MNKRARLARRILREHRRGADWHQGRLAKLKGAEVWGFWSCTHCPSAKFEVPRAYR